MKVIPRCVRRQMKTFLQTRCDYVRRAAVVDIKPKIDVKLIATSFAAVEKIVRDAMENVVELSVPLTVDVHAGDNRSQVK